MTSCSGGWGMKSNRLGVLQIHSADGMVDSYIQV